jgi:hypothetical protein
MKLNGAILTASLLLAATAQAQPPAVPGLAADGSITADGVTYTAEDLADLVTAYRISPSMVPADLPGAVRAAVYQLAAGQRPLPPPPPAGGAQ